MPNTVGKITWTVKTEGPTILLCANIFILFSGYKNQTNCLIWFNFMGFTYFTTIKVGAKKFALSYLTHPRLAQLWSDVKKSTQQRMPRGEVGRMGMSSAKLTPLLSLLFEIFEYLKECNTSNSKNMLQKVNAIRAKYFKVQIFETSSNVPPI